MSEAASDRAPQHPHNPSDDYPPTRPGLILIAIALVVVIAGFSYENWPDVVAAAKAVGW
jgi:hypothetical protein